MHWMTLWFQHHHLQSKKRCKHITISHLKKITEKTYPLTIWGAWRQFLLGDDVTLVQSNKQTRTRRFGSHFPVPKTNTLQNCFAYGLCNHKLMLNSDFQFRIKPSKDQKQPLLPLGGETLRAECMRRGRKEQLGFL